MNGTKWQEINSFSPEDICTIIEASARAGVSKFQYKGLDISFGTQTYDPYGNTGPYVGIHSNPPLSGEIEEQKPKIKLSEQDKAQLEDAQFATMALEDPEVFEQHIMDEMLAQGKGDTDGEE